MDAYLTDTLILGATYLVFHAMAMYQVRKNHSKGVRK